ncbi:LLM class flavin-dependent oxidoreductase [Erwinia phyllosphaerae]|uniref:LLM class flavin-dependent oxidoreductase n=1 Tax=Erwinia phyllosphaerae TaxID=2853256 RepID=UPI001FEE31A7|nr:LLM class flavin-dependent oxidoreductase [Erwinia phyllosphaerae]MBV4369053.1 LLM class flavin-dependent oxidoreductase [Erwinia phyllosphaerae]
MHLALYLSDTGLHAGGWRHPAAQNHDPMALDTWLRLVKKAEEAKFDFAFIADKLSIDDIYGSDITTTVQYRPGYARPEPMALLTALSLFTHSIGLGGTLSTTYGEPFHAARTIATLDHFSAGRMAWNAVTSTNDGEAKNFSRTRHLAHQERYKRAGEFIDAVHQLLASWQPDALVADKESGIYARPDKVSYTRFAGEHFQIKGPLTVAASPQGRPVQILAGVSQDFKEVATRVAEVIFTVQPERERAQQFYQQFKTAMAAQGRLPQACKILPGIMPIVGATQQEAEEKRRQLDELVNPLAGLSFMSASMNYDLSQHDPDALFPDIFDAISGSKGRFEYVINEARRQGKTLAEVAKSYAASASFPVLVGTPESIASEMIEWVESKACDGFVLMPADMPASLHDFADYVVPELQKRGAFRKDYQGKTLRDHLQVPLE